MTEDDTPASTDASLDRTLDLGRWLGRHEAFALVAGRCSAAEVESLRRIRDEKLYLECSKNWDDFCRERLGASRRRVDTQIRLLKELGPGYFQVALLARVSPEDYRAIAPHVEADGLRLDGELIPLRPENRGEVAAAVKQLKQRAPRTGTRDEMVMEAVKRCHQAAKAIQACGPIESPALGRVALALHAIDLAARENGLALTEVRP